MSLFCTFLINFSYFTNIYKQYVGPVQKIVKCCLQSEIYTQFIGIVYGGWYEGVKVSRGQFF
jgi:hypothetical protein